MIKTVLPTDNVITSTLSLSASLLFFLLLLLGLLFIVLALFSVLFLHGHLSSFLISIPIILGIDISD